MKLPNISGGAITKLYLDTCVWCRPFDKADERILKESEALVKILRMADKGQIEILGSSVLLAEISLLSLEEKRAAVEALIRKSCRILKLSRDVTYLAERIMKDCGIDAMDAFGYCILKC